jgi:hypothetical protein
MSVRVISLTEYQSRLFHPRIENKTSICGLVVGRESERERATAKSLQSAQGAGWWRGAFVVKFDNSQLCAARGEKDALSRTSSSQLPAKNSIRASSNLVSFSARVI